MNICCGCGKTIEKKFFYCPWCGLSKISKNYEDEVDFNYFQYKERLIKTREDQVKKLQNDLELLEKELSVLVLSAEMHK